MSKLFKLKFTPLVDSVDNIVTYKIDVEYFNKYIVGSRLDMLAKNDTGAILLFKEDFIEVDLHYLDRWGDEYFTSNRMLNDGCFIKEENLSTYIKSIKTAKGKLEELCLKKKKHDEYYDNLHKEWADKQPFEVTI